MIRGFFTSRLPEATLLWTAKSWKHWGTHWIPLSSAAAVTADPGSVSQPARDP